MRAHELKNARQNLALTQATFGRLIGLDGTTPQRTVRAWELGENPIPAWVDRSTELLGLISPRQLARLVKRVKEARDAG